MKRISQLDGVRGVAILLVLIWHYGRCQIIPGPANRWLYSALGSTWTGVDLFFVLSGFLIAGILLDHRGSANFFQVFYLRRICRIFPLYFLLLALFVCLASLSFSHSRAFLWLFKNPLPIWSYATFTQNILMGARKNYGAQWLGPTWSLAVEEQFYLLVPLMIYFLRRRTLMGAFLVGILAAPILSSIYPGFRAFVNMPFRADSLLSGATLAVLVRSHPFMSVAREYRRLLVPLSLILLAGAILLTYRAKAFGSLSHLWFAGLYTVFIFMAFLDGEHLLGRVLRSSVLVLMGQLSYGIYMFHQAVSGLVYGWLRHGEPKIRKPSDVWVTLLALSITLLVAFLSYRYFEAPILRLGHRFRYSPKLPPQDPVTNGRLPTQIETRGDYAVSLTGITGNSRANEMIRQDLRPEPATSIKPSNEGSKLRSQNPRMRWFLLFLVLALAAALRVVGLNWGLDRGYHPDEIVTMRGVAELDPFTGDFSAPSAYFEGTFNYYLWSLPISAINHWEQPSKKSRPSAAYYGRTLLVGRAMTGLFDALAVFFIFLAVREAINAFYPALFAAFLYAVIPMQVIYAHFMRPHILSNLLCAIVFWLSFKLIRRREWWLCMLTGVVSGLGAATRYPVAVIVVIPCLCLLFDPARASLSLRALWQGVRYLLSGPVWWIGLGFTIGLFIGEPILFFDPRSVVLAFNEHNLRFVSTGQFGLKALIDFTSIWKYLRTLIPYAMWPLAWVIPYLAIAYLLVRKRYIRYTIPILLFSLLYLYPMAKGYYNAVFARATLLLFPGFCILAGIACYDLLQQHHLRPVARRSIVAALLLLTLLSLAFDCAYVRAMQRIDPRSAFRADLRKMAGASNVQVGVQKSGGYFYTVTPAIRSINNRKIKVRTQEANESADYYLVGFTGPTRPPQIQKAIERVQSAQKFKFVKQYEAQPRLFGEKIDLSSFPVDMTYPFPEILLFRSTGSSAVLP